MMEAVDLFRDAGTVDELGMGAARPALHKDLTGLRESRRPARQPTATCERGPSPPATSSPNREEPAGWPDLGRWPELDRQPPASGREACGAGGPLGSPPPRR